MVKKFNPIYTIYKHTEVPRTKVKKKARFRVLHLFLRLLHFLALLTSRFLLLLTRSNTYHRYPRYGDHNDSAQKKQDCARDMRADHRMPLGAEVRAITGAGIRDLRDTLEQLEHDGHPDIRDTEADLRAEGEVEEDERERDKVGVVVLPVRERWTTNRKTR